MKAKTITLFASLLFALLITSCDTDLKPVQEAVKITGNPAIDKISKEIISEPENALLYAQRAELFYENEGFDEAIQDLRIALKLDSVNVQFHHLLADVYLDYYKSKMALKTMERVAKLYPEHIPTLLKLSEFYHILKMHEESMRTIDQILQIDPQNAEAFFMFGLNFKELKDVNRAINSFQKAVDYDPDLIDAWINLGQLYTKVDPKIAVKYFTTAMDVDPRSTLAIHAKADFLRDQEDLVGAIGLYKKIGLIDQQYEEAYFNAGLLYMELDSIEAARGMFDITIGVDPMHAKAYFFRGLCYEKTGEIEVAKENYKQALRFKPNYELPKEQLEKLGEEN